MLAIVQSIASLGVWAAGLLAARWGYKVALAGAILTVYLAVYAGSVAVLAGFGALIPSNPFTAGALQFFPDSWAVNTAMSASLGTAALMRTFAFWRGSVENMVKAAS
jgi:hypothetical protein